MSWLIEYNEDISEYLDLGWIVLNINRAIFRLRLTDDGLPTEGELMDYGDGLYWWIIAGHSLLLERTERITSILALYTGELRDRDEIEAKIAQHRA